MPIRFLVALVMLLAVMIALFLFLLVTDTALSAWNYLKQAPHWLQLAYFIFLVALPLTVIVLFWSWLRPRRRAAGVKPPKEVSADQLRDDLLLAAQAGVDVTPALRELHEQRRRKSGGEIYIAVFGEVSSGKSSLVRAILPQAEIDSDPRAGTTREVQHFAWTAASGDRIVITDLPGFNFGDDATAREETRRAHLAIFLCDADLTGSQVQQLKDLQRLGKPLILALNKADRYAAEERERILARLAERSGLGSQDIVAIEAGGREEVVRMLGEGMERRETRDRPPQISALLQAIQRHLDSDRGLMETLRDTAVLLLASEKLESARASHRARLADELVGRYSRRAVVGALAAVAPGSDLVIQGVLATQLLRELSRLYEVPVKEMEIESFLKLAGGKLRNMTAITLAIAGNALKAFPGLGTLSGGLIHAVAYGMIFDSLGRAAAATLASRGELRPFPAAEAFEELMHANLDSAAGRFAQLAIGEKQR